jgi:hypothetical protein
MVVGSILDENSRVRVPWDSRPYFTASDFRLPFSSPPTTLRAAVEVFDPASTRGNLTDYSEFEFYVTTDGQPASLSWHKRPSGAYDQIFITCVTVTVLFLWGALSDERPGLSFVYAAGPRQRSHFLVRVP